MLSGGIPHTWDIANREPFQRKDRIMTTTVDHIVYRKKTATNLGASIFKVLVSGLTRLSRHHAVSRMRDLDDRMLADIGLTRGDINTALSQSPSSDPTTILADLRARRLY